MKLECRKYTDKDEGLWDDFVRNESINGTFLHSRKFYNHNPLNREDDHSLIFFKKNKPAAVFPAILFHKENELILHSYLRATYGGFIINKEIGVEESLEMVKYVIEYGGDLHVNEIIVRNPFRIFHRLPCDETDYAMWYYGFNIKSRELESAIPLNAFTKNSYQNGAKYNIKKALKSVLVKECDLYPQFWELLIQNLSQKHNSKPTHTLQQFLTLLNSAEERNIRLFGGFIDDKFVCGVITFNFPPAIHAQYIASDPAYQDVRPLNAVIDHIIDWGLNNDYKFFNLGTANEEAGRKINLGLFHFKEGFGGRGVLRETMSLTLK